MALLKIKLARNLRRSILRGHPWVYREALAPHPKVERAQLALVSDTKGELAWAIYDPHAPLALRILSLEKAPPNAQFYAAKFARALARRCFLKNDETNSFRLFNGEGDGLAGLVCDVYDGVAVLQFDGQGPGEFWDKSFVASWLTAHGGCKVVTEKSRRGTDRGLEAIAGSLASPELTVRENGVNFKVNLEKGQKTGFFLDQRDNRQFVRVHAHGLSMLNLFSYTGGFSVNAGMGGASRVASLDVSKGAIDLAVENWRTNGLEPSKHEGLCVDVFEYLRAPGEEWDHIVVDPPSMSHSEDQKLVARAKYIELFTAATKRVRKYGKLSLSSCSSHISFTDFYEITAESLAAARRRGSIVRVSGQAADHPFPHACPELQYLKFLHLNLD